eukprot:COSAG06_NODE_43179_length_374_cov_1.018182_1_plen_21_part_10
MDGLDMLMDGVSESDADDWLI